VKLLFGDGLALVLQEGPSLASQHFFYLL